MTMKPVLKPLKPILKQTKSAECDYKADPNRNPVIVVYRRPMVFSDHALQILGAGAFTHCELYLPKDSATFAIFAGGEMQCSAVLPKWYTMRPDLFAWHMFVLNKVEYERLRTWNINQVCRHCHYNFTDLAWKILPVAMQHAYVTDLDKDLAHTPNSMFCSQAVVLALREACSYSGGSPHIAAFAMSMNSRLTTPSELANKTVQHMGMDLHTGLIPLTARDAHTCMEKYMFAV
jgi:hypothetical protein